MGCFRESTAPNYGLPPALARACLVLFCLFVCFCFPTEDSFCGSVMFQILRTSQSVYKCLDSEKPGGLLVGCWLLVTDC